MTFALNVKVKYVIFDRVYEQKGIYISQFTI